MSSVSGAVATDVLWNVNAAVRYFCQIARSSAVIVNQPNLNMYLPGSVNPSDLCPGDFVDRRSGRWFRPCRVGFVRVIVGLSSSPSSRDRT
jgi:hypothetical protein